MAIYFIVCGLLVNGGVLWASLNLACLQSIIVAPLGLANLLFDRSFDPTIRIILLAIVGYLYGTLIKTVWNVKWWLNFVVIIIVCINSCGYTLFLYDLLGKALVEMY